MKVEIHLERYDHFSFLVVLVPVPELPVGIKSADNFSECAVIAINDVDGNELYGGVVLSADEKDLIGEAMSDKCVKPNQWVWCNLYN